MIPLTVGEVMTSPVETVTEGLTATEAARRMREHSVRRVPVLDGDELVGIVTTTDLAHYLPRLRATILRERTAVRLPPPG
jgi:CBS domain-containing protein